MVGIMAMDKPILFCPGLNEHVDKAALFEKEIRKCLVLHILAPGFYETGSETQKSQRNYHGCGWQSRDRSTGSVTQESFFRVIDFNMAISILIIVDAFGSVHE